ncbi:hypothetical protein ACSNOH_13420 [Streptomyces sp. URMC 127]|uniref:hypothetical protein n=1 Tax=Streptomyces sp. URMC 127 TaxID=3423402 RepID=UPI003F1BE2BE
MTSASIDDLLADAAVPTSASTGFDAAAGLRRLAAESARPHPVPALAQARLARQRLGVVCRWALNEPDAAAHVERLVQGVNAPGRVEDLLDIEGALVFACLLFLTGHCESAQHWWELAAGAGLRAAAYCLHLHHAGRGELREAQHWLQQAEMPPEGDAVPPPVDGFFELLSVFTRYVRQHGSTAGTPTKSLEAAVQRLVPTAGCGIVSRPDRRLADELYEFGRR